MAAGLGAGLFAVGCGGHAPAAGQSGPATGSSITTPLATSFTTAAGTWAVVPMGGSPAFWQLVILPAGGMQWSLVTPPGVADNGGVVAAGLPGRSVVTGFRPSQNRTFSPLASTADGGRSWSPDLAGGALAGVPDALAAYAGGRLLALMQNGPGAGPSVLTGNGSGRVWSALTDQRSLAGSLAGARCGIRALTAVAFSQQGAPLIGASCDRPGTVGIFAHGGDGWHLAGPLLPVAGTAPEVVRLRTNAAITTSVLSVGTGPAAALLAAWTSDNGAHWAVSTMLLLNSERLAASGFGAGGAVWVLLSGGQAETLVGPGASWRALPTAPAATAALAFRPGGGIEALTAHDTKLGDWQVSADYSTWNKVRTINVPIQYGSSG